MRTEPDGRRDALATFDQDVWWCNREGLTFLIDTMDDGYRHTVANWLLDRAAKFAIDAWAWESLFGLSSFGPYDDGPHESEAAERSWADQCRDRMDTGEHLDWLRSTALYQRMAA